jgi:parvulin-like peptidyl-prolyl isomerase
MSFAFGAKEGDVLDTPGRTAEGWAVVALKQRKSATREEFEKDRTTFEDELLRMKRDEALSLYVKRLREQAKDDVKVDEAYVLEAKVDGGSSSPEEEDEP